MHMPLMERFLPVFQAKGHYVIFMGLFQCSETVGMVYPLSYILLSDTTPRLELCALWKDVVHLSEFDSF